MSREETLDEETSGSKNAILNFYKIQDGIQVTWAHAVNNRKYVEDSLKDEKIMYLEADVFIGLINKTPIMAHPPKTTSDITLQEWLHLVFQSKKGAKLDFKETNALEPSMKLVKEAYKDFPNYKPPLILNADILVGPNANGSIPVNSTICLKNFVQFEDAILSLGWKTGFTGNDSKGYGWDDVRTMHAILGHVSQDVTFPVRASLVEKSKEQLIWLLNQNKKRYSLTVWTSSKDTYQVESLAFTREFKNAVFFDLPEEQVSILQKLQ